MAGAKKSPQTLYAMKLWQERGEKPITIEECANQAGINPSTLYRALFRNGKNGSNKKLALRK